MSVVVTILCENSVGRAIPAIGEHGFACLVETPATRLLVDSGQGLGIERNARVLGKDLREVDQIVISHGHYDHAGGLDLVLAQTGPIDVYAHPQIFVPRYHRTDHALRFIGIPKRQQVFEALGARFCWTPQFQQIAEGVYVTGEVERRTDYEKGEPSLVVKGDDGAFTADPFVDDMAVVVRSSRGLVVVLGCAHAGMINTLLHVQKHLPGEPIHAVVGGTHLGPASPDQFERTVADLERFGIEKIGVSHCTGQARAAQLRERIGQRFFFGSVGAVLEI
ncbi:MAG: MBL fold metallo-hydrolase [Desulfuromonadaceae bacterium]|nr:MBL fold metallo-hydrolase [Desulfuromonadaceae bacterium]